MPKDPNWGNTLKSLKRMRAQKEESARSQVPQYTGPEEEEEKVKKSDVNVDINSIMSQGLNSDTARDFYLMDKTSRPMRGMGTSIVGLQGYNVEPDAINKVNVPETSTDLSFMDKLKLAFTSGNPEDYQTKNLKGFSLNEAQNQNYSNDASGQPVSLPAMNNFKGTNYTEDTAINLKEKFAQANAMPNEVSQTNQAPQSFLDMMTKGATSLGGSINSVVSGVDQVGGAFLSSLFGIEGDEQVAPVKLAEEGKTDVKPPPSLQELPQVEGGEDTHPVYNMSTEDTFKPSPDLLTNARNQFKSRHKKTGVSTYPTNRNRRANSY